MSLKARSPDRRGRVLASKPQGRLLTPALRAAIRNLRFNEPGWGWGGLVRHVESLAVSRAVGTPPRSPARPGHLEPPALGVLASDSPQLPLASQDTCRWACGRGASMSTDNGMSSVVPNPTRVSNSGQSSFSDC